MPQRPKSIPVSTNTPTCMPSSSSHSATLPSPSSNTRHIDRWIRLPGLPVVCILQESAPSSRILSLPSPRGVCPLCPSSQVVEEESGYPKKVTGTGILIYFNSLIGISKHRQEKRNSAMRPMYLAPSFNGPCLLAFQERRDCHLCVIALFTHVHPQGRGSEENIRSLQ